MTNYANWSYIASLPRSSTSVIFGLRGISLDNKVLMIGNNVDRKHDLKYKHCCLKVGNSMKIKVKKIKLIKFTNSMELLGMLLHFWILGEVIMVYP